MSEPRPETSDAERDAAAWMVELTGRSVTIQALDAFREWRRDPANDAAYRRQERLRDQARHLARDPDILAATREVLDRPKDAASSRGLTRRVLGGVLAAGVVAGGAAVVSRDLLAPGYATGRGEQKSFRLEDGTRVHLNTDSRVTVRFAKEERRLVLERGQAFFDVAHDASRPFIVRAGGTDVRALGTKFDVRRDGETVRVTLLEGAVRVRRTGDAWTLAPNQELSVAPQGASTPRAADAARTTSWTTGRLNFRATPLAAAVAEVNRYGSHPITLAPGVAAGQPVSGVFDIGDTEAFVQSVTLYFGLRATTTPQGAIELRNGGPSPAA